MCGHVKGAFTGAVADRVGHLGEAEGGTLFLDEVADLPVVMQVKLLRLIQEKTFRRVGGTHDQRVDVRIVSATNRRLQEEVAAGRFREDLYYRLNVIEIAMPPLHERREDIALLVDHFVQKYARELGKPVQGASDEVLARLMTHRFRGNVRELENVIERAVALSRQPVIGLESLPPSVLEPAGVDEARRIPPGGVKLEQLLDDFERGLLLEALECAGNVKKRAAQLLGISFRSFRYRLEKLGLEDPQPGEE
jgi:two-component system response regulator PilR (NtrC family)